MTAKSALAEPTELGIEQKSRTVGVILAERIYAAQVVGHQIEGPLLMYPDGVSESSTEEDNSLVELPTEPLMDAICEQVLLAAKGYEDKIDAVGVAIPGLIRQGVVEEAPNLPQLKGARAAEMLAQRLREHHVHAPVTVINDADAMAAGLASVHGRLEAGVRVWTLGTGIGYGCFPFMEGVWEGGHAVVTLDDKENYCGCGGRGHMEGIMGHRAMRLRFLDMEPEEVFEAANRKKGADPRCVEFKHLWHRALAAATATSIHQSGAGKFYITGYNVRFLELNLLRDYLHQMVKMSPLQSYSVEIVPDDQVTRMIGAAVAAEHAKANC